MYKYLIVLLLIVGLVFGSFQNCSESDFTSYKGTGLTNSEDIVIDSTIIPSFNLAHYPKGDICVAEGEQKIIKVDVVDGGHEHSVVWRKTGSNEVIHSGDALGLVISSEVIGLYEVTIDDGYKKEEKSFSLSYCPVNPQVDPQIDTEENCTAPFAKSSQTSLSQIIFANDNKWIGYDVSGDPKPEIKWHFYKNPGEVPSPIFPDFFEHYYEFEQILQEHAGYYYIVANNGCGDPFESPHYNLRVIDRPINGQGTNNTEQAGEVTGWIDKFEVNSDGFIYIKGWTCAKKYNNPIMIKVIAQNGNEPVQVLAQHVTFNKSQVKSVCFNSGADLHGIEWTSKEPAINYRESKISIIGIHPSGNSDFDKELPPKGILIE